MHTVRNRAMRAECSAHLYTVMPSSHTLRFGPVRPPPSRGATHRITLELRLTALSSSFGSAYSLVGLR